MKISRLGGWLIVSLLALAGSVNVWAIWAKYSPFEPGSPPGKFPHNSLVAHRLPGGTDRLDADISFRTPISEVETLRLIWNDDAGYILSVSATRSHAPFSMPVQGSPLCDIEAVSADLNRDGVPDYIVVTHSGGNGLAAQITFITFVLSSPNGYVGKDVESFDARASDLFDLSGDDSPEFVHCMSVWGDLGKDGRAHNYWAYNLVGFSGTDLISANGADRRFPKWIMFSHAANHTETRQLTAEQRERKWLRAWENKSRVTAAVPFMRSLATEQRRNARQ